MTASQIPHPPLPFAVPTADQYVAALTAIEDRISPQQMAMLEHHFKAHNRTTTKEHLSEAASYKAIAGPANIFYSKLSQMIGEALDQPFGGVERYGKWRKQEYFSTPIGEFSHYQEAGTTHWQLIMHHELTKALTQLGWFD